MVARRELLNYRIWRTLLVWNCIALIVLIVAWIWIAFIGPVGASARVTALDRAGVINEAKLRQSYPNLAENLRYKLGEWIAENELQTAFLVTKTGAIAVAVNLLLLVLLRKFDIPGRS